MDKIEVIALFGPAGSGKDYLLHEIIDEIDGLNEIVSCTTRPKREGEVEGVNYFYLTNQEFYEKVDNGDMLEAVCFNDWWYGTPITSLSKDKPNIGVFNIAGIECLMEDPRLEIVPIYVEVSPKNRLMRALTREENPDCHEICRRFLADVQDFAKLENDSFDYYSINNDEPMDIEAIEEWIENIQSCFEDSES